MDIPTTLVVMAAGMGSRFGGLKQLEPLGKNGEVLLFLLLSTPLKRILESWLASVLKKR